MGVLQLIWLCEIMGESYVTDVPKYYNAGTDMEHGLKDIAFYVQNI